MRHFLNISVLIYVIYQKKVCQYWSRKSTATTGAGKNLMEEDVENNITWKNIIKPLFEDDMN